MLLTVDDALAALAAEAGARGYAVMVSGRTIIGAEYLRDDICWYVDDVRCSYADAQQALAHARAVRRAVTA